MLSTSSQIREGCLRAGRGELTGTPELLALAQSAAPICSFLGRQQRMKLR